MEPFKGVREISRGPIPPLERDVKKSKSGVAWKEGKAVARAMLKRCRLSSHSFQSFFERAKIVTGNLSSTLHSKLPVSKIPMTCREEDRILAQPFLGV